MNRDLAPMIARGAGWGGTILFAGVAILMTTCAAGLITSPLTPLPENAELLGQKKTSPADLVTLLAFVLPMCVVFWRAAWVANGSRQQIERRFLSPGMGWFVAVVVGGPSLLALAFGLLSPEVTAAQSGMAAAAAALFCSAPYFAKLLATPRVRPSVGPGPELSGRGV